MARDPGDEADHWAVRIRRFGIEVEHVLHAGDVFGVDLRNAPHVLRQGFKSFSVKRRRTVSREMLVCSVRRTSSPAKSSSVQRARPAGGLEQAVATSGACSLPDSFRFAPGRGSSLSAAFKSPSTKRRFVRYTFSSDCRAIGSTVDCGRFHLLRFFQNCLENISTPRGPPRSVNVGRA